MALNYHLPFGHLLVLLTLTLVDSTPASFLCCPCVVSYRRIDSGIHVIINVVINVVIYVSRVIHIADQLVLTSIYTQTEQMITKLILYDAILP